MHVPGEGPRLGPSAVELLRPDTATHSRRSGSTGSAVQHEGGLAPAPDRQRRPSGGGRPRGAGQSPDPAGGGAATGRVLCETSVPVPSPPPAHRVAAPRRAAAVGSSGDRHRGPFCAAALEQRRGLLAGRGWSSAQQRARRATTREDPQRPTTSSRWRVDLSAPAAGGSTGGARVGPGPAEATGRVTDHGGRSTRRTSAPPGAVTTPRSSPVSQHCLGPPTAVRLVPPGLWGTVPSRFRTRLERRG